MVSDKVNRRELEYVKLAGYSKNIAKLNDTSSNIGNCIDSVPILNNLIVERHNEIKNVKELSKEILHAIKQMDSLLLKHKFGDLVHRKLKNEIYVHNDIPEKQSLEQSRENLKNLKENLEKMEKHFREI